MAEIISTVLSGDTVQTVIMPGVPIASVVKGQPEIIYGYVGVPGPRGPVGYGVPAGGTTGQRLVKASDTDFDLKYESQPPAPPAGAEKTVQYNDAGTMDGDDHFKWDKNTRTLRIGIEDDEPLPDNPIAMVGAIDSYLQAGIKNTSETAGASADYVATADNGTDDANYVDMGINSSVYSAPDDATGPNDSYIDANGGDLFLIVETPGKELPILVGGPNDASRVGAFTEQGLRMEPGKSITNRPEIFSGTGAPPSPVGLANGTLYFKYEV